MDNEKEKQRLKIKKIRKYNVASKVLSGLSIIQGFLSGLFALAGVYSFISGLRGKYYYDNALMTYLAGILSISISLIGAVDIPEINKERDEYRNKILTLEEEIKDIRTK